MIIQIKEGEDKQASKNNTLGEFELSGIPPDKAGEQKVVVTFEVDSNGILLATAVC